jgi:hypothetical protein
MSLLPLSTVAYLQEDTTSVTTLELYDCEFEGFVEKTNEFFKWIKQRMRIRKLSLCLFDDVVAPNFFSTPHVEDLEISLQHISSREGCDAVKFLIECTTSIELLNIYDSSN